MARTVNQRMGDAHEADIQEWLKGRLQKGSGNQWHAQGDVKNGEFLTAYPVTADGKSTLGNSISVTRTMWRKIVEQTFNQTPAIFLRFYKDDRLREVEVDLAVVPAQFFSEVLEDARLYRRSSELVASVFEGRPYFCPTAEEVERSGAGFDECCDRPDLHVSLPDGVATETLSRILSDRQRAKVKTGTGCDCCR